MSRPRVFVCSTPEVAATWAAASLVAALRVALKRQKCPQVVLSSGQTPVRTYELLRTRYRHALAWERLHLRQMDEYAGLAPTDGRRFSRFLRQGLVEPLGMHVSYLQGDESDADMLAYEAEIVARGGISVVLHGIGINGHLGFNEPGSSFLGASRRVNLAPSTRRRMVGPHPPSQGVTLGLRLLHAAHCVRAMALGESKAAAVQAGFWGPVRAEWPVSSLQEHANVQAFVDVRACPAAHLPLCLRDADQLLVGA